VYLLLTGRRRAALRSALVLLTTIVMSAAITAGGTWTFWTNDLYDTSRVGRLENAVNQTIKGMLVRIHHTRDVPTLQYGVLAALVLCAGLFIAVLSRQWFGESWGLCCCVVTGLLVSPISWSHHWVWCIALLGLTLRNVKWLCVVGIVIFGSFAVWMIPHGKMVELHLTVPQILFSGWYVYFGLVFLGVAAERVYNYEGVRSSV
jgi:alpha-1,2-mannosyltransferase